MSDIFISYAREDRPQAQKLAQALEAQGWSLWWDRTIPAGKTFDEVIEEAIDAARCIVVLWSERSIRSRWVRTEAEEGARRNVLVPVQIEQVKIPLAFRRIQAADLSGWSGEDAAPALQKLVEDLAVVLGPPPRKEEEPRQAEAEAERRREEQEKRRLAQAEVERKANEAAKRRRAEAEAARKREEQERRRLAEAEAARKREEQEKRRLAQAEAERNREEEKRRLAQARSAQDLEVPDYVKRKAIQIICEQLSVEESEVTLEASFEETLNADALDIVELVMAFEEGFNIEIPDDEAEKIRTVGDALRYLAAR